MSRRPYRSARQRMLSAVAKETKNALPAILEGLPDFKAFESSIHDLTGMPALKPEDCPNFKVASGKDQQQVSGFRVTVVNDDTLDTAIRLAQNPAGRSARADRVLVLNLASDKSPGGGWLNGSLAQEESICYRSSLYMSLYRRYYPLGETQAIYSPNVILIRNAFGAGHALIEDKHPREMDAISVVSVAAIRRPETTKGQRIIHGDITEREIFARAEDRELTKAKMRLTLRVAASAGHRRLVLGALGCGAFKNPTEDVAICWIEVLGEEEFARGWFEEVVFAVLDKGSDGKNAARSGEGNFGPFEKILGDVVFVEGRGAVRDETRLALEARLAAE